MDACETEMFKDHVHHVVKGVRKGTTSLVGQWLRFLLPVQGAWVRFPDQGTKIPHAVWYGPPAPQKPK